MFDKDISEIFPFVIQCDQIGQNFAAWAKFLNYSAVFMVYFVFDKILKLLWQKLCHWANFHRCKWPNIE